MDFHKKKDGSYCDTSTSEAMSRIQDAAIRSQVQISSNASMMSPLMTEVFRPEHYGYVRGMGLDVTRHDITTPSGQYRESQTTSVVSENTELRTEIRNLQQSVDGLKLLFETYISRQMSGGPSGTCPSGEGSSPPSGEDPSGAGTSSHRG